MPTLSAMRDAIQTRMATLAGLRAFDLVQGRATAATAAWVRPENIETDVTQGGAGDWELTVDLYVPLNSMRAAQDEMDTFWPGGSQDLCAAVEADRTLGGIADFVRCIPVAGSYSMAEVLGGLYLTSQFRVTVGVS